MIEWQRQKLFVSFRRKEDGFLVNLIEGDEVTLSPGTWELVSFNIPFPGFVAYASKEK